MKYDKKIIYDNMRKKTARELYDIWKEKNTDVWTEDALHIAEIILGERKNEDPAEYHKATDEKLSEAVIDKIIKRLKPYCAEMIKGGFLIFVSVVILKTKTVPAGFSDRVWVEGIEAIIVGCSLLIIGCVFCIRAGIRILPLFYDWEKSLLFLLFRYIIIASAVIIGMISLRHFDSFLWFFSR